MAMVGQTPGMEDVFPGYRQKRREGVSEVLQEALLSLVAAPVQVAKVPAFSKFLIQALKKKAKGQDVKSAAKVLVETAKIPSSEWSRLRGIGWNPVTSGALGEWSPAMHTINVSPRIGARTTPWHEFTHKRQWIPSSYTDIPFRGKKVSEEVAGRVLRLADQAVRANARQHREFPLYIPIERHARNVAATMTTGSHPSEFDTVYRHLLGSELEKVTKGKYISEEYWKELWDQAVIWAAREGVR